MAAKKAKDIEQYDHRDKERANNPPVGLVTPELDVDSEKCTYAYDPHLDPQLQWAGKAEHTAFEVPTVSLHVHERIDPRTIIEAVRKPPSPERRGVGGEVPVQLSMFGTPEENPPLREAIEFYRHKHNWSNRLVAGDSLLVMNSLLEKEGLAGQVQMIYIDPPYGIKYGSNFQPFVSKNVVRDGKDEDLTAEPETIKAFRDTWELGIHSYLAHLRDRLLLARELLAESGSIFVQISDENVHLVRCVLDEVFGAGNFVSLITFVKTAAQSSVLLPSVSDYLLHYAKKKEMVKYHQLYRDKISLNTLKEAYSWILLPDDTFRHATNHEIENGPKRGRLFRLSPLTSQRPPGSFPFEYDGQVFLPGKQYWKTHEEGLRRLESSGRLQGSGRTLFYRLFLDDFPCVTYSNNWTDTQASFGHKVYVVQTNTKVIQRCMLMTTDPGDLVLDPTCGSGTTAHVAEQWGRRWITCDTSRVAITLAKQRLMTAIYNYYELAHSEEGVGSGFRYKTVPHITLKSIANDEPSAEETLYDQPYIDRSRARVSGPFTVEAVPAPAVQSIDDIVTSSPRIGGGWEGADASIARSGETLRQAEWRDELFRTGIRAQAGQRIEFTRLEPLPGTRWLQADGESKEDPPRRAVVSFGPEHAPLEQRQVARALEEAYSLVPKPKLVVFAAFQFDPEASKDIDETHWPGVALLKAQMNADMLTEDLKKKRSGNESFWLIGQPDVRVDKVEPPEKKPDKTSKYVAIARQYRVEVLGFDYYNPVTGNVESGGTDKIALWMLDPDYDGRSLFPRQVFFPMAGEKDGWARLARNLKAEIDPELIEVYRGTVSLPFVLGDHRRVAVKIVDDRGIESLKIIEVA